MRGENAPGFQYRQREFAARKLELTAEERAALPKPPPRVDPAAEPVGPVREYPPLDKG